MFEIESDTPRFILVWRGFGGDDVGLCQPGSSSSYYDFQVKGNTLTIQYHSEDDYGGDKSSKTKKVATFPLNKNYDYYERRIANQVLHSREEFNSLNHILRNDLKSVIDLNQRKGRLESFLKRHTKENYIHPHIDKAKYELDRVEWRIRNIQEHINKWEHLDDEIKEWARVKRLVKQSGGAEHDVLHQFINDHPQHLFINDAKRLASSSTKDLLNRINAQDSLTWVVIKDQSPLSTTPPYMMSQTEITVAQYRYCVESNVCSEPISKSKCNWSIQGRENHPINCINWAQARTFAQWIGTHVDLPTSRTWLSVYSEQPNMTPFDFDKVAWYKANSTSTNEVGLKQKNKFGLYDMSGNVWEWLLDGYEDGGIPGCKTRCDLGSEGRETYAMVWHKDVWEWILDGYKNGKLPDCKTRCGSGSEAREIIGGGWYSDAKFLTGNRVRHHPSEQNAKLGFRLVKFLPR